MPKPDVNNPILHASQEHKLVLEYMAELEELVREFDGAELSERFRLVEDRIKKAIQTHFGFEEDFIFPAILEGMPVNSMIKTILKIQREHGVLTEQLNQAFALAHSEPDSALLRYRIRDLGVALKKHALVEVEQIFPHGAKNPKVQLLIQNSLTKKKEQ